MKYLYNLTCILTLLYCNTAISQTKIKLEDVTKHLNQEVTICDEVANVLDTLNFLTLTLKSTKKFNPKPSSLENPDPIIEGMLRIWIFPPIKDSLNAHYKPLLKKSICITGVVGVVHQVPTIFLDNEKDFTINRK